VKGIAIAALVAACATNGDSARVEQLEKRIAELEAASGTVDARDRATFWCPLDVGPADTGKCFPEMQVAPSGSVSERRRWLADAEKFQAEFCDRDARTSDAAAACIRTRLVVCSTHDAGEANLCFASWKLCRRDMQEHPERKCWAYLNGERLQR